MIQQENFVVGTMEEVVNYLMADIIKSSQTPCGLNIGKAKKIFKDFDYAVIDEQNMDMFRSSYGDEPDLKKVKTDVHGWYGLKQFDIGFGSLDLDLFSDYYGGGCGQYGRLYDGMDTADIQPTVQSLLIRTIEQDIDADEGTLVFAEIL